MKANQSYLFTVHRLNLLLCLYRCLAAVGVYTSVEVYINS